MPRCLTMVALLCLAGSGGFAAGAAPTINAADYPSLNDAVG